jgi:hypothetical protein
VSSNREFIAVLGNRIVIRLPNGIGKHEFVQWDVCRTPANWESSSASSKAITADGVTPVLPSSLQKRRSPDEENVALLKANNDAIAAQNKAFVEALYCPEEAGL